MEFKEATDRLIDAGVSIADLAREMKVSEQALRQARLSPAAKGYRKPPDGWKAAVIKLTSERARMLFQIGNRLAS